MAKNTKLNATLIDSINGIETIKSLCEELFFKEKIKLELNDYLRESFQLSKLHFLQNALKQLTQLFLSIVILWFGASMIEEGRLSIGQLITFNMLLIFF
ncbi:ABC transporter transmembrane region domain protein [Streptococcus urinalis 2285-97]|uniref:ABC transporter transmembrane region domain protein n=1 Tax=Streptococcus urinalis 2285-97 TaxID=764291 RepID=G5KCT7_9STRE|nr:ABC transporter transmembrane domain-containing protein [Streptococcus urinalis]EHJ55771.1 ABC transporter transmembrane region domain protein [Streptococcus urinalis 2285-97]